MNYFLKKIFNKLKVYYFYLINENSRQFFFILIWRKISHHFIQSNRSKVSNYFILKWCNKQKISENLFYQQIGLSKRKNFFEEKKSYYLFAQSREKNLKYKMGGMAHLNLIYNLTKHLKPIKILETGVAFGWSTLVFILSKTKKTSLTSIDLSYPAMSSYKYVAMAVPLNLKKNFKLCRGIDTNFLKLFNKDKKYFNLIHYDSDKSYIGRKKNYDLIWKILKKNGCFISDDISDNSAFYEFVKLKKTNYHILKIGSKYVGVVFK